MSRVRGTDWWFWIGIVLILGAGTAVFVYRSSTRPSNSISPRTQPDPRPRTPPSAGQPSTTIGPPPTVPISIHQDGPGTGHGPGDGHAHAPPPAPPKPASGLSSGLTPLIDALRKACYRGDPNEMTQAQQQLTTFVNGDAIRAAELIEAFRREPDPTALDCIVGALACDSRLVAHPSIVGTFLDIAERDSDSTRRRVALLFLSQNTDPTSDLQDRMRRLAIGDSDPGVQVSALHAISMFAEMKPGLAASVNRDLLDVAGAARDPMVRTNALAVFRGRDADAAQIEAVGGYLMRDTEGAVRISAAETLGQARPETRAAALTQLATAFGPEPADEVRRMILMSIVRAGRGDARATLERLLPAAGAQAQDVRDYLEILATGETNPDAVIQEKAKREADREGGMVAPPGTEGH